MKDTQKVCSVKKIVNDKIAKAVEFFDIPKPQKKRMFLTGMALGFLILSWCVPDADAGNLGPISCGSAGCLFVGSDGKIYNHDGGLYASTTGAVLVANPDNSQYYWATGSTAPLNFNNLGTGLDVSGNYNAQYWVKENGDVAWGPTYAPNSIVMAGANAILADGGASPGGSMENAFIIRSDGTSNVCAGSNNVEIINISNDWAGYWMCRKSDGTLETNYPGFDAAGMTFKHISGSRYGSTAWCGDKTDDTMHCQGVTAPSGTYRDVSVKGTDRYCAARLLDSAFVCWNSSATLLVETGSTFNPNPPVVTQTSTESGISCSTYQVPKLTSIDLMDVQFGFDGGTVETEIFTGASKYGCRGSYGQDCGDKIVWTNWNESAGDMDILQLYNFSKSSVIQRDSWKEPGTATGARSLMIADDYEPQMLGISAIRSSKKYYADVWQFADVQNPSVLAPWAYNINDDGTLDPIFASGGVATVVSVYGKPSFSLLLQEYSVPQIGFRMGRATEFMTKTECTVRNNSCKWDLVGTQYVCKGRAYNGYYGSCSVTTNSQGSEVCSPLSSSGVISEPIPEDGSQVITDQYGNVISVTPGNSAVQGSRVQIGNVFNCPEYEGFLDIFPCSVRITKNVWQLVADSVTQTNESAKGINSAIGTIGSGAVSDGTVSLTGVTQTGANIADDIFRGAWNNSFGGNNEFNKFGKFALYGALFMMFLAIVFVIAIINRK